MTALTTPREIDEALAAAYHVADEAEQRALSAASTMRHLYTSQVLSKKVEWGRPGQGAKFPREATPQAAADWFRTMDPARRLFEFSNYSSGTVGDQLTKYDEAIGRCIDAQAAIGHLEKLYRGWPRFFVVTSSTGHVHRSMSCHTCRPTTTYGWLPELSGKPEPEALAWFTAKGYPSILCTVCFPSAPVAATGGKLTRAQAVKLAA